MTDHLELYRRMARSIRFFPPISLTHLSQESVQEPLTPALVVDASSKHTIADVHMGPPIDPSAHTADLVNKAVSKRTVLPINYTIPENLGDRISRLTTPKPVNFVLISPKIPQVDSGWTSTPTIEPQPIKADHKELIEDADLEAPASATVVDEVPPIPETPEEEPIAVEETLSNDLVTVVDEAPLIPETPEENIVAVAAEPVKVEEVPELERVSSVIEAVSTAFQKPDSEEKDAETVGEPAQLDATASEAPAADTLEPLATAPATTEVEDTPAPTLLERVSAVVETVSTLFQKPDTQEKDTKTVGEPAQLDTTASEAPAADTLEPLATDLVTDQVEDTPAPTLLQRVSAVVEVVSTAFQNLDIEQKDTEIVGEPAEAQKISDSKTAEVTCPKCESTDLRKNGRRQGKQRYICKDCGRQFVTPDSTEVEDTPKNGAISHVETVKAKAAESDTSLSDSTSRSSKPQSKKTKAKGFGGRKAK